MKDLQEKILNSKKRVRVEKKHFTHKGTLQIAKGEYNLPFISILKYKDSWMVVYHTQPTPPLSKIDTDKMYMYGEGFHMKRVDEFAGEVLSEGIEYVKCKPSHFCNYTCLYTYCELNSLNIESL